MVVCRTKVFAAAFATLLASGPIASGESWPTHQRSPTRNAVTPEPLPAGAPTLAWEHTPAFRPQPAWHGPAKWDAYAVLKGLHSMRGYDQAYHTIVVDGAVYYGSSTEDCVRRLDADSGQVVWAVYADGPVRVAPTYDNGRLYFGSDDGHTYCIDAESGEVVWRHAVRARGRLVLNNEKLIPLWPIRTGVTVVDGIAYYAASLLPWRESYLIAADAETGEERYRRVIEEATFEGPLVVSPRLIAAPQGRVAPAIFNRHDGEPKGSLSGGGGSFVVLVGDDTMMHGPGNKGGWLTESSTDSREKLATHKAARGVVGVGDRTFFITEDSLVAIDYSTKDTVWKTSIGEPLSLIAAGDALVVGGVGYVAAFDGTDGSLRWKVDTADRAKGLAFAEGRLVVSFDTGAIHGYDFTPGAAAEPTPWDAPEAKPIATPVNERPFRVAVGPWLRFTSPSTAEVRWRTAEACPTHLVLRDGQEELVLKEETLKVEHLVKLDCPDLNHIYQYRLVAEVGGEPLETAWYECDTFFNYRRPAALSADRATPRIEKLANLALGEASFRRGVALVLGASEAGEFEESLARQSRLKVCVFEPDPSRVAKLRQRYTEGGVYGGLITVHEADEHAISRITDGVATLVTSGAPVSGTLVPYDMASATHLVSPTGKIAIPPVDSTADWLNADGQPSDGDADWSHVYGLPNNSAYAGEELSGVKTAKELAIQWIGRPGPRYQADRTGRKTPPIAAGGRLFLQGLDRIVAVDSYCGSILWSLETPHFGRYNLPRDCGNWCADGEAVYAAVRDRLWRINSANGEVQAIWAVSPRQVIDASTDAAPAWGYVARVGDLLLGSRTDESALFNDYWGGPGWYDQTKGAGAEKVASDQLFALDPQTGERRWSTDRLILNTTITATEQAVYFAECRLPEALAGGRRLSGEEVWSNLWLVGLDLGTGEELWSRPLDDVKPGVAAIWLAETDGRLALITSAEPTYEVNVYDALAGEPLWRREADWGKGKADHGTHLSRPAIVGGRLVVRPAVFDFATGATDTTPMPVSGCGTYACTSDALFFRAWSGQQTAVWAPGSGEYTRWSRLRPDCWLSTIPAHGLLLAPEGGGGCSCGSWLETSLAFVPVASLSDGPRAAEQLPAD